MMSLQIGKHRRREEDRATGSEVIAGNEDLLTLILLRLPVRSLLRFKSVSKHWLSMISNPQFRILKSKLCCKDISGLLMNPRYKEGTLKFEFFPLDYDQPRPSQRLDFVDVAGNWRFEVIHHCNGLVLCRQLREAKYHVVNLTTNQHTTVSFLERELYKKLVVASMALAFDPRKSPHFKLVCLFKRGAGYYRAYDYYFGVYSSETGRMTKFSDIVLTSDVFMDAKCSYWNGFISWILNDSDGLYVNVDEERFGVLPMPPMPGFRRHILYYGESSDHLHLVQAGTYLNTTKQFDVYEMDREYSGWFVKFHVDLRPMFTETIFVVTRYTILAIVDKDDGQNPFIVFCIPGKAVQFDLKERCFTKTFDFSGTEFGERVQPCFNSIHFIESLHPL